MRMPKSLRRSLQEIAARQGNFAYHLFSEIYAQGKLFKTFIPRILPKQKGIEKKAVLKLAQVLIVIKIDYMMKYDKINVLDSIAQRQEYRRRLAQEIQKLLDSGKLERTGTSIFLREQDISLLADLIEVDNDYFCQRAASLKILRSIIDDPLKLSYLQNELIQLGCEQYSLQYYRVITKDGQANDLTLLVDETQVIPGDRSPSVVLVPSFACNKNLFNLNNRYSLARDLAQKGYWVYLFEPRGMGRNKLNFDSYCTLDTLIDYDLPAAVDFIHRRSKGKPVILIGHSMGGVICEFMLQLWAKENNQTELNKIKGLITLGNPTNFDKNHHIIYPLILWLNYVLAFYQVDRVPLDDVIYIATRTPGLRSLCKWLLHQDLAELHFLVNPANFPDNDFMYPFIRRVTETTPLGIGFQFQKAMYTGKGITRMDQRYSTNSGKYNYTENISLFPANIPYCRFVGADDPLAPPRVNDFTCCYNHDSKNMVELDCSCNFCFPNHPSQLNYFIVPATRHMDLLYGTSADILVKPLVFRAIEIMWAFNGNNDLAMPLR